MCKKKRVEERMVLVYKSGPSFAVPHNRNGTAIKSRFPHSHEFRLSNEPGFESIEVVYTNAKLSPITKEET